MSMREDFERVFGTQALMRPLFYQYPGGIRFELSEGGSAVDQFLTALSKAQAICASVLADADVVNVVLSAPAWGGLFGYRGMLQALHAVGVEVPRDRSLWTEPAVADVEFEGEAGAVRINLAFQAPKRQLPNLLWCALSSDLGIEPSPRASVFLSNLRDQILLFPYDDRGMDVVGPNHQRLSSLYREFRSLTLEYDRARMEATFNTAST
jgi:hypothetical protein